MAIPVPIAYYKFDGNANDSLGSYNGTTSNVSYVAGKINQAGDFDSAFSSFFEIPATLPIITGNITFSFWAKRYSLNGINNTIFSRWLNSVSGRFYYIYFTPNNELEIDIPYVYGVSTTSTFTDTSSLHLYTIVKNGNSLIVYVDGTLNQTFSFPYSPDSTSSGIPYIGRNSGAVDSFFDGVIDEFGIWNVALTAGQVSELYNNGNGISYPFINQNSGFFNFI